MDQRIGVEHLHSTGRIQGLLGLSARGLTKSQDQDGPDAFASGHQAV